MASQFSRHLLMELYGQWRKCSLKNIREKGEEKAPAVRTGILSETVWNLR